MCSSDLVVTLLIKKLFEHNVQRDPKNKPERDIKTERPNDITVNKKKICGILNETLFYNDLKFLVIGVGINIVSSPNIRDYPTTNLNEVTNRRVNKTKLLNKIIKAFDIKIK